MPLWSYWILVAFVSMVIGGVVANARGADGAQGLAAGLLLGPIGVAVAFVLPLTVEAEAARQLAIAVGVEKLRSAPPEKPAET